MLSSNCSQMMSDIKVLNTRLLQHHALCCVQAEGALDLNVICCMSGNIDEAGVCDGNGNAVAKLVDLDVANGRRRHLLDSQSWLNETEALVRTMVTEGLLYPEGLFTIVVLDDPPKVCSA